MQSPTSHPPAYTDVARLYESQIYASYARGEYEPVIFPYHWLPFLTVVVYLFLEPSHSRLVRIYRYASFSFFAWWGVRCMQHVRSPRPLPGYGMGLVNAWSIMWMAALIIFNDVKSFRRVWALRDAPASEREMILRSNGVANGTLKPAGKGRDKKDGCDQSTSEKQDGDEKTMSWAGTNGHAQLPSAPHRDDVKYYWQSIPASFWPRTRWLWALTTSMRAPGWEHQIRSIPTPPDYVFARLPPPHPTARPTVGFYTDRRAMLRYNAFVFAATYLSLDILKCVSMHDPFFWGYLDATLLPSHPFAGILTSKSSLTIYRSMVSLTCVGVALRFIFTLNALAFGGIFAHNRWPLRLGIHSDGWLYPNLYGSPSWVATHGLTGWWGAWWHQIFRLGFEAPTFWACRQLGWGQQENRAKVLGLTIAFAFSGILHGAGSYTTWPESQPFSGSFMFFALQGVGTFVETLVVKWLRKQGVLKMLPTFVKRILTLLWVVVWMALTAPLLVNDFARSGLWLFEPVPFSFVRLLGFRLDGQDAWAWRGTLCWWHSGSHWWQSGIAF